ncbi:hypothetical protein GN958_ATG04382 [Phytophthora infestans]|uniref:EF-hand domain-containing protein n=2 Tax=Phytophthora infestans TaxID=4787 RepID=A0A8S9V0E1_PHYIN|nr:hypothetical protein GN958_ATG04382 [Phytophthora infestans]
MDVMMSMTTDDVRTLRGQFTESLGLEAFVRLMKKSLRGRIESDLDFVVGVIELFHTIDVNGDAVLDWDEFTGYMLDAGQAAKADSYFEGRGRSTKHYVPLAILPPDSKTPLRHITSRVQRMRLLAEQNAVAYFEANSDVVCLYALQFDRNDGPRHLSTLRLHTAFQEHTVIDVVYVSTRKSLVTSSVLVRGYLSVWSVTDLHNPVMTHRLESLAAQEHLCWIPSLKCLATSAVMVPCIHSGKPSDPQRDCYRPNAGIDQPHTTISQLELWDISGKTRAPPPGTIATKEVTVVQERLKGVTAVVAFRSLTRTYLAAGREDGILSVVDTESGDEVGTFDAHGSGVKALVYSSEVESIASVGFHSYADETSLHISTWKKTSSGGMLTRDSTLRQHQAPVEILAFVDSNHQLISVDRTETFIVYSSVMRTPTSEPWECLQTFQYSPPPASNWHLPQKIWSMFVVPETAASDPVLVTAGTRVKFYDFCEIKVREEVFFAHYCSALNVVVGATSTKLLLWKGDTGVLWKTYEYAGIVMANNSPIATSSLLKMKQTTDPASREAQDRAITAVCVDDRERKIIVGDDTGCIKVVNAVNGNVMKELNPHIHCIVDVSYVLYGKRVISISSDSILHISDENNPQGFYVPFGGGPVQSVLLQSLRFLPEVEQTETETLRTTRPEKYLILRSTGNEALNLVAVLVANPRGSNFVQVWNFDISHPQGTCLCPQNCGDITCLSFCGSTADIVGGTSTGRVFLWSPIRGTTSYRCIKELSSVPAAQEAEEARINTAVTHILTACVPDTNQENGPTASDEAEKSTTSPPKARVNYYSSRPILEDRLRQEQQYGVHVFASDETGFVTQWHVQQHPLTYTSLQTGRPSSSNGKARRGRVGDSGTDATAFQHEEMALSFDSLAALYHHGRMKKAINCSPLEETEEALDVVTAIRQWRAHGGPVLSLEMATDPFAVVTSSFSGQIKLWGVDGKLYGALDHFATRRAPLNSPWDFPVDMKARRQQLEEEARELLQRPSGSAWKKTRVSVLEERLSLTTQDFTFKHERLKTRKKNARASEVGRAVRNFILKQTTSGVSTKRKAPSSAIHQDTSSLHSVLRELDELQLHTEGRTECSSSRPDRPDSRGKKYAMVTLADVKSTLLRPRTSSSTVHCGLPSKPPTNNQRKHLQANNQAGDTRSVKRYVTSAPSSTMSRMELVEYLWQGAKTSNQDKEPTASSSGKYVVDQNEKPRKDNVLRYHVKMAHTWQPYQKR